MSNLPRVHSRAMAKPRARAIIQGLHVIGIEFVSVFGLPSEVKAPLQGV